ncbi:MAG TPA: carboxypeptidase regulatory-like domain-containing protein, partial [Thermoanaerobaculia bacterium]
MQRLLALCAGLLTAVLAPLAFAATSGIVAHATSSDPIAGARVTLRRMPAPLEERIQIFSGTPATTIASTTTGKDGVFTFSQNIDGMFLVEVEHDGFAPESVLALAGTSATTIPLKPAALRTGRVTANGKPVKGAIVAALAGNMFRWTGKTNDDGVYTMPAPYPWAEIIAILHPDFAPFIIENRNERTSLDAKLEQGTNVSGKVVDAEQKPVANARVLTNWATAVSAEDGSFTLRGLAPPLERIEASAGDAFGEATPGNEPTTIVIAPRPTISGAVRGTDKRPVAGVPLMAAPSVKIGPTGGIRWTVTDERGNYRFEHLNGNAMYSIGPHLQSELPLQRIHGIAPGAKNADLVATTDDAYTGIVLDERRKPVTGAVVQLAPASKPLVYGGVHQSVPAARTSRDGRFRIPHSYRTMELGNMRMRLQVSRPGYAIAMTEEVTRDKPATIILPQGIEVEGEVVDSNGAPVAGAGIVALQRAGSGYPMALDSSLSSGMLAPFVETDAEGKFTLRLNATTHDVGAWKQGTGGTQSSGIEVVAGMPPLKLVLEPNAAIRGRVVRGTEPVKEGSVMASGPNNSHASADIAEDGTFTFETLTAAQYRLEYMDNNGTTAGETMAKAPANDVVITLAPASKVHGKVIDSETRATLRRYSVQLQGEHFRIENVNDEETFTLEVPEGTAELLVVAGGYQKATHRVNVAAGESVEVTIPVTRGRVISGVVRGEDGAPVGGASVRANREETMRTTPDGQFVMTVAPTAVQLDVRATGYVGKKIELEGGTTPAKVDVTLARGRSIRGRVLTNTDAPVPRARVIAQLNDATQQAETDADGAFTMSGLEGGTVRFFAMSQQQRSEPMVVDLSKTSDVVIRIGSGATGTIAGTVKGFADGSWQSGSVQSGMAHTFIGRDGKYRLENVRAGEAQVTAMLMGINGGMRTTAPVRVTVIEGGEVEANLELGGGVTVQGRVTEDGVPVSGRSVGFNVDARVSTARTNAAGEYVVHGLEQGTTYFVTVGVPSDGSPYLTQHTVTGNDRFDIRIERARVEGRVIEASGRPIAGAWISVVDDNAFEAPETRSDESGAFALSVTRSNTLNVRVSKDGFATVTRPVTGNAPMLIMMTPAVGLRVRLVDARSGQALSGWAQAVDEQGQRIAQTREMNSDGTLTVPVGPGTVRITAGAMNYASQTATTAVPRDGELRFALTPG